MSKVYISGKISGLSEKTYMAKFNAAEEYLKNKGHEVINPARTNGTLPKSTTYDQYMDMSMILLSMCDTIFMLDNWMDSPGAKREFQVANANDLNVLFETIERVNDEKEKQS